MGEEAANSSGATTRSARPDFFPTGGPLPADRPGYVRRAVDERVEALLSEGRWINLSGAPGSGKTSLLLRNADRMRGGDDGVLVALIDFSQIAQRDSQDDAARWFYAVAFRIARQLRAGFDLQSWWSENALLSPPQRLLELFRELVLAAPGRRVVLLFDATDALAALPLGESFLQGLRLAWDARTTDPDMSRLQVVLCGTGVDQFGRESSDAFPFAVAAGAVAAPFTLAETLKLGPALGLSRDSAELAMQRIYDWVAGHPALTQCLAKALARGDTGQPVVRLVDRIIATRVDSGRDRQVHAVLTAMERLLVDVARPVRDQVLVTMGQVAKGQRVLLDGRSAAHDRLLRAGVLVVSPDGFLLPASRLMRRHFNAGWANAQLPMRYGGLLKAAAVLLLLVALPAWYRLYLPQPHVTAMTAPGATPAAIVDAYSRLARWPGHGNTARRVAVAALARDARRADSPAALEAIASPLATTLAAPETADAVRRAFWRRQLAAAERAGDRPGAVLAAIAAIGDGDTATRRRLAGLLGSDLPELTGVLAAGAPFDALLFRPRDGRLVTRSGASLRTWDWSRGRAVARVVAAMTPTALAAQPAVLRFDLPARRRGAAPVLSLTASHARPTDIEITVTDPGGRSATVTARSATSESPRIEFPEAALAPLAGAAAAGTWTVSFSDTRPGVRGGVSGVTLGGVAPAEAGGALALPDPAPSAAASVVLDHSADRAVAWPGADGNRAAVWDLRNEDIEATFPVSPGTRLLGLVNGDREALLIDGVTLSTRRLDDGVAVPRASLQVPAATAWASASGRWVVAQEAERDARLFVIDLLEDRLVATIGAGVAHERVRVSDDGRYVVAADADRTLRVWSVGEAAPVASLQIDEAVRDLDFSPAATHVLARLAGGGMLAWRFGGASPPERWGGGAAWSMVEDEQSGLSLIGSPRDGFRVHDFVERRDRSLPWLGTGEGRAAVLRVRDNMAVVSVPERGVATLFRPRLEALPTGTNRVRQAWLSDDGSALAFADAREAFTVVRLDAGARELDELDSSVMMVAHANRPSIVRMTADGRYALSIEPSGMFRIRDVREGEFFDFIGRTGADVIDARFAADGMRFLLLRRHAVEVYATRTGRLLSRELRDVPLAAVARRRDGWIVSDADGHLFRQPPSDDGVPAGLTPLRVDVPASAERLASAAGRWVVVAAADGLQLVDVVDGRAIGAPMKTPAAIREMRFAADGRHVVARAGHWLLRLRAGAFGLSLVDVRLLPPDMLGHGGFALSDAAGSGAILLRGLDEPVPDTVWFDYRDVDPVDTPTDALVARWRLLAPLVRSVPVPFVE